MRPDFSVSFDGSLYLVQPLNAATQDWLVEHTAGETSWLGSTLYVEHHYIENLVNGMVEDGLVLA
jgi:hypothetical protein